jgi:hypothetical protein
MRRALRQFVTIARLAATETIRSPFLAAALLAALLLAGVLPLLGYIALLEKRRLVTDSLLALLLTGGSLSAMLAAVQSVGGDLRRRSAHLVLSKPVERGLWPAAKAVGVSAGLAPFWFCLALAVLWGSRTAADAYVIDDRAAGAFFVSLLAAIGLAALAGRRGRAFPAALALAAPLCFTVGFLVLGQVGFRGMSGSGWQLIDWRLLPALVMAAPGIALAAAVASALALRGEPLGALLVGGLLFVLGLMTDYLFAGGVWRVLWVALPSWLPFWSPERANWPEVGRAAAYALLYGAALHTACGAAWARKDLP